MAVIEDFRLVGVSPQFQPFEPSPTNALCLSFDAHYESNDVMQKTVPFGPPPRISNPIILSRQPCPKTRVPKINPIKDCLALGNRIELECIVLRAFPAHVNDLILNFLDDVANGLFAVWIKFRDIPPTDPMGGGSAVKKPGEEGRVPAKIEKLPAAEEGASQGFVSLVVMVLRSPFL